MRRVAWIVVVVGLTLLGVAGGLRGLGSHDAPATDAHARAPSAAMHASSSDTPQAKAYLERNAFARDVRAFVRDAPRLPEVDRSARAEAYIARIARDLADRRMSAGEAFLLETALIRVSVDPGPRQDARLAALAARHRTRAHAAESAWVTTLRNDPRFNAYKSREAAVVSEVMAMASIPHGLTRDEYLRRRLMAERVRVYR